MALSIYLMALRRMCRAASRSLWPDLCESPSHRMGGPLRPEGGPGSRGTERSICSTVNPDSLCAVLPDFRLPCAGSLGRQTEVAGRRVELPGKLGVPGRRRTFRSDRWPLGTSRALKAGFSESGRRGRLPILADIVPVSARARQSPQSPRLAALGSVSEWPVIRPELP
jgi:hypothetical protein